MIALFMCQHFYEEIILIQSLKGKQFYVEQTVNSTCAAG